MRRYFTSGDLLGGRLAAVRQDYIRAGGRVADVADLAAEVGQRAVAHRALGEVEADLVVAQLFGRLLLDGHAAVLHER